jgi:hypothetical protein
MNKCCWWTACAIGGKSKQDNCEYASTLGCLSILIEPPWLEQSTQRWKSSPLLQVLANALVDAINRSRPVAARLRNADACVAQDFRITIWRVRQRKFAVLGYISRRCQQVEDHSLDEFFIAVQDNRLSFIFVSSRTPFLMASTCAARASL